MYKLSSKDPAASCGAITEVCEVALQLRLTTKLTDAPSSAGDDNDGNNDKHHDDDADDNTDLTSSNGAAVQLCQGDRVRKVKSSINAISR